MWSDTASLHWAYFTFHQHPLQRHTLSFTSINVACQRWYWQEIFYFDWQTLIFIKDNLWYITSWQISDVDIEKCLTLYLYTLNPQILTCLQKHIGVHSSRKTPLKAKHFDSLDQKYFIFSAVICSYSHNTYSGPHDSKFLPAFPIWAMKFIDHWSEYFYNLKLKILSQSD